MGSTACAECAGVVADLLQRVEALEAAAEPCGGACGGAVGPEGRDGLCASCWAEDREALANA